MFQKKISLRYERSSQRLEGEIEGNKVKIKHDAIIKALTLCALVLAATVAANAATLWHNTNTTTIQVNNSISCNLAGEHANTSYWRPFTLSSFGYTGGTFSVSGVRIGIEESTIGSGGTTQPITVRIYANSGAAFPGGTRTLIGTTNTTIGAGALFFQDIPVTVPAQAVGTQIIVEIFTPSGQSVHNRFFIGSNNLGESAPGYISAVECGAPNPTILASAGAPNMHTLIGLTGLGTTAAHVSVSGRVVTADGRPIRNANVSIVLPSGETRTVLSSSLGYYQFDELEVGHAYILSISSKRYTFSEPTRLISLSDELSGQDFVAIDNP